MPVRLFDMQITLPFILRKYCLTVVYLLILASVNGQPGELPPKKMLTVSDFKGIPDESDNFLARTFTVTSLQYSSPSRCAESGKVRVKVETKLTLSHKSWMKLDRIRSRELLNELLSHEQGHYDIGQTFAIDLKNTIANTCFDKSNYKFQADSLFRSMNKYYDSLQRKYDTQTEYMRNRRMQARWKVQIASMLNNISK